MSRVASLFLDTNVLVYARDRSEPVKGPRAQELLTTLFQAGQPVISIQVLSEFFWTVTRKLRIPLSQDEAVAEARRLMILTTVAPLTPLVFDKALELIAEHQLSLWDAQIVAAALSHGAATLISEDFQHRRILEGLLILNPFAADFDENEIIETSLLG